jgi:dodecin
VAATRAPAGAVLDLALEKRVRLRRPAWCRVARDAGMMKRPRHAGRDVGAVRFDNRRKAMAKKIVSEGIYRVTEVIGTSTISWEDAAKNAVTAASKSLRDLRIAEITKLDMKVEGGKVVAYRARVSLSFKYEG